VQTGWVWVKPKPIGFFTQ